MDINIKKYEVLLAIYDVVTFFADNFCQPCRLLREKIEHISPLFRLEDILFESFVKQVCCLYSLKFASLFPEISPLIFVSGGL